MTLLHSTILSLCLFIFLNPLHALPCYRFMNVSGFPYPCGFTFDHPCYTLADTLASECTDTLLVVTLQAGTYTGPGNRNLTIHLPDKTLHLRSNGTVTFDAESKSRILSLSSGSLLLEGLSFLNGYEEPSNSTSLGGCIQILGSLGPQAHELRSCGFHHCRAYMGGAVYAGSKNLLNITDSQFTNSNATYGGAIYMNSQLLNLQRSLFLLNAASSGGAIQIMDNENVVVMIEKSVFSNNSALYYGGALGMNVTNITITANDVWLVENTAQMGAWSCFSTNPSNSSLYNITWNDDAAAQSCSSPIFGNCTPIFTDSCVLRAEVSNCSNCPAGQCVESRGKKHCFGLNKATQDCLCIVHQPLNVIIIAAIAGGTAFLLLVFFIACRLDLCPKRKYKQIQ
eukprot:TRINITY_DN1906_c0_g1_i2.p1 TRINITY_DN1906_c0_g1~~TRINITY_DN1906_c0_g1_i2.p1  ORF type:complete len:397 (+),score=56.05 TRINITY_DN1906_c0_g1_i2:125-1315(+)